jgi:hypothetical protein
LDGSNIYLIKRVELIPFAANFNTQTQGFNQLREYVEGIKKLLTTGYFYFSYNYDLTLNRQKMGRIRSQSLGGTSTVWDTADRRYVWNANICQDFFYQKIDNKWIVPIIQGYVEYKSCIFDGKELEMMLISRRRHGMAGTRYLSRGLDDDGNVANFVETEQLLIFRDQIYSFVQIRGSVPLFWQ